MALHILANQDGLSRCQHSLQQHDALLLIDDGVYLSLQPLPSDTDVYALGDDMRRRGIPPTAAVKEIDMAGFVELSTQHPHCLSW